MDAFGTLRCLCSVIVEEVLVHIRDVSRVKQLSKDYMAYSVLASF